MRARLLVSLAPLLVVASAHADPAPAAVSKQLEAVRTALLNHDSVHEALAAVLAPGALTDIQHDLMDLAVIKLGKPASGWTGTCGWVAVEAAVRSETHPEMMAEGAPSLQPERPWHWLELVVADGAGYAVKAMGFYATMPDSSLKDDLYSYVKELPAEPSPSVLVGWLAHPAELAAHLSADPAVTVYGTSAADHAVGPVAAKKLLASWRKLDLDVLASTQEHAEFGSAELITGDCAAVKARLRMRYQDGAVELHAFAIAHKIASGWEVVAVQYATDRTFF